jgi:hypothetical protein
MRLHRLALLLAASLLLVACPGDDDDVADNGPPTVVEPDGGMGEPVVYRGGIGTEVEWEMTVTVTGVECDVEVGNDVEIEPAEDRFCAAHLQLENTGDEPNTTDFVQASVLQTDDGELHPAEAVASAAYADARDRDFAAVAPGEATERSLLFSLPDDAEPLYLHLQAAAADGIWTIELS